MGGADGGAGGVALASPDGRCGKVRGGFSAAGLLGVWVACGLLDGVLLGVLLGGLPAGGADSESGACGFGLAVAGFVVDSGDATAVDGVPEGEALCAAASTVISAVPIRIAANVRSNRLTLLVR